MNLGEIRAAIIHDPENRTFTDQDWEPVYSGHPDARLLIVGQAPGRIAQNTGIPWNDASGNNLRTWLGLSREQFYDANKVALVPMDFYFPGSLTRGDAPPRPGFAEKWHPLLREHMPHIALTILIGQYAQAYYLGNRRAKTLTDTVKNFRDYAPEFFPLVHPSPRNNIWQKKNPWFQTEVIPALQKLVQQMF